MLPKNKIMLKNRTSPMAELVQLMKRAVIDSLNESNSEEICDKSFILLDNKLKKSIHTTNKGVRHGY